jgi:acetyl-CoA acetyltransferase
MNISVVMHDTKELGDLRPVFDANGIVTAGNSSGINDGAAASWLGNHVYRWWSGCRVDC